MRYNKYSPSAELEPFVQCYFVWEGEATQQLEIQSPPNGFSAMVFNYADPTWACQNNHERMLIPKAFVCGQFTSNYQLVVKGKIGMVGIVFKPSSFYNFFACRMPELVNNRMPLNMLLGVRAEELWSSVRVQTEDQGRIDILHNFLSQLLPEAKSRRSIVDEAVEYIDRCHGRISVEEVAVNLKISRRYLEKKFLEKVGVSPKFYARVKRFSGLSNKVAHSQKIDWQDVVFENGFHDQSHLVKEYIEFNKMSPSDYHRYHRELSRFMTPR